MTFVFAAGGTAGHIFPALAIAEALHRLAPQAEVVFIGAGKEVENKVIPAAGYRLEIVPAVPFSGKGIPGTLRFMLTLPVSVLRAVLVLRRLKPRLIVGFGGYPTVNPFLAGILCSIPRVLHEQNVQVGLANRVLSRFAALVFGPPQVRGFPQSLKVEEGPNPVRAVFHRIHPWMSPANATAPVNVLIVGGSQGAATLNSAIAELVPLWKKHRVELVHIAGDSDCERVKALYAKQEFAQVTVVPFTDKLPQLYENAQLIVCRAGAMTAAEICAAGRPAVFVPLAIAGSHQKYNVKHLAEAGACRIVEQGPEFVLHLEQELQALLSYPATLQTMAARAKEFSQMHGTNSADYIAGRILEAAK